MSAVPKPKIVYIKRYQTKPVIDCMIAENDYERKLCRSNHTQIGMDSFPIKIYNDLLRYYISHGKLRNALYLICQANWGMRAGDVRSVRFCHIFTERGTFKESFTIKDGEEKTGKQNIYYNNEAVKKIMTMYLESTPRKIYEYIFTSVSNYQKDKIKLSDLDKNAPDNIFISEPMSDSAAENIVKDGLIGIGIHTENGKLRNSIVNCDLKLNTHSLRKTFANIFYETGCKLSNNGKLEINPTMLKVLQEKFMHTNLSTTGHYNNTMETAFRTICLNMNIGLDVLEEFE